MALKDIVKKTIQRSVDIPRWIGYTQWQHMGRSFFALISHRFKIPSKSIKETTSFAHMVEQFQLSELDLIQRQKHFQRLMGLWYALFAMTLAYALYLMMCCVWLGAISMVALSAMTLSQAFQYHFWSFQLMQRRLNCTLREWWQFTCSQWWSQ
jgi:hypothetical protein